MNCLRTAMSDLENWFWILKFRISIIHIIIVYKIQNIEVILYILWSWGWINVNEWCLRTAFVPNFQTKSSFLPVQWIKNMWYWWRKLSERRFWHFQMSYIEISYIFDREKWRKNEHNLKKILSGISPVRPELDINLCFPSRNTSA